MKSNKHDNNVYTQLKYVFWLEEDVSRAVGQNSLTPYGNNNFRLARDQVVLLETASNLCASRHQENDFYAVFHFFELGGTTKHLMAGPRETVSFV